MLIEFGASNYFSFKEWFTVSFKVKKNNFDHACSANNVSRVIGIKGANASGKTNVLKCLQFLFSFIDESFEKDPEEEIRVKSFFNNKKPISFFIEFESGEHTYKYELEVDQEQVIAEKIFRKKEKYVKVVERNFDKISYSTTEFSGIKKLKLRKNASITSIAKHHQIESFKEIIAFSKKFMSNISETYGFIDSEEINGVKFVSRMYANNSQAFSFVKKILLKSDTGIKDIKITKTLDQEGKDFYFPTFYFEHDGKTKALGLFHQSSGTKALYLHLWMYAFSIGTGSIIALDEIDIKLHPMILPYLLETYLEESANSTSQIIFTSHNTEILDYLGKYRTYLVNKDDNESYCYRLDEIPGDMLRNDRPISPIYKDGKIGGIPKV